MAKRYISIWFPYLLTDAHTSLHLEDASEVLLIVMPEHGRMVIKSINALAQNKGLSKGMVLADCRAIYPQLKAIDYSQDAEQVLLKDFAIACIQFTPTVGINEADGLMLDATGCCHLWGGEDAYTQTLMDYFEKKGYYIRIGMADTMAAAWAMAHYGKTQCNIIAPAQQAKALAVLPSAALQLEAATNALLQRLGLYHIQDFIHMPNSTLRKRFGIDLVTKLHQALGMAFEFLEPVIPPVLYQERLPCLEPIANAAGIHIALENLISMLCATLEKDEKGLRRATFRIYRIDNTSQEIEIGTHIALRAEQHLLKLFELKTDRLAPEPGIELFLLEAPIVEHLPIQAAAIWKDAKQDKNALSALLDRIAGKLGNGKINRYLPLAQHWPERATKTTENIKEQKTIAWPSQKPRPVMLLPHPESIEVMVPLPDYPPLFFKHQGLQHKVCKADGPERIEAEWWIEAGLHRDYYCIEDEQGNRYWIFRLGHYDSEQAQWFLHGFFA